MGKPRRLPRLAVRLWLVATVATAAHAADPDFARIFAGRAGCFELYDLTANKLVLRSDPAACAERTSPCSTFKVPIALMAFDAGILQDESSSLKWDGKKYSRESWNHDHTAATWMRDSVVWFSQRLTPQLGPEKVKSYLERFDYGNHDTSGGLTTFWLESTLTISPDEQLRFWERFWREELPVSKHAYEMTKKITYAETSPAGWVMHGKTGSGERMGWYAGHIAKGDRQYVFVTRYVERGKPKEEAPPGWIARDLAKRILGQLGLF